MTKRGEQAVRAAVVRFERQIRKTCKILDTMARQMSVDAKYSARQGHYGLASDQFGRSRGLEIAASIVARDFSIEKVRGKK